MHPRNGSGAAISVRDGNPRPEICGFPARTQEIAPLLPALQAAYLGRRFGLPADRARLVATLAFGGATR